ncbi:hypothetical protein PIB30_091486 [Stylosanthes scabra]|uniref:Uncharacterized protein n=1 Tax=Stylosanthes scabra TaxID=79078 RepID=A0ABU6TTZ9_9FABA|nr:hypothetical protein [Stylosanthes scabra]
MGSTPSSGRWPPGNTIYFMWGRYLPTSNEKESGVIHHRRQLDLMTFHEFVCLPYRTDAVDRVIPQFGGVLKAPHQPLNINFMHAKDRRGSDQWWPQKLPPLVPSPAGPFHQLPADDIPVDATQRLSAPHPHRPVVPDVLDNRRPARRMMVGTMTTARDWKWLDEMMANNVQAVPPTRRIRRMAEGRGRPRGWRGGRGRGEGSDTAPTQLSEGGASTSHVHHAGTSTQADLPSTPQT